MGALSAWAWAGFLLFITAMLALDLGVFHRKSGEVGMREALVRCAAWFALAMVFNLFVLLSRGPQAGLDFFTGYLIEICLSVDNVFVFILIFSFFQVPKEHQHRVLFWGIIGAAVMRALFIGGGIALLDALHWVLYLFGAFLVFAGVKLALPKREEPDLEKKVAVRLARRFFPVTPDYVEGRFFVRREGRWWATPLFVVLVCIETTDVVFAVDSIPAILGITRDGFVAFTSNIFAILGLRSLYFALAGTMQLFRYLGLGLAVILVFIGAKMLLSWKYHLPTEVSLGVIMGVLATAVVASLVKGPQEQQ